MLIQSEDPHAPGVVVDVPADFHQVPLDAQTERRTSGQLQVLATLGLSDPAQREAVSLYLEALAIRLRDGDIAGTAFCAVQLDGRPSTATLTLAVHPTNTADPGLAVLGAGEALRRDSRVQHVESMTLGGRAVLVATSDRSVVRPEGTAEGAGEMLREIAVFVPVPGRSSAAMVTLSTPCLDDAETYRRVVLDVARSVRVETTAAMQ